MKRIIQWTMAFAFAAAAHQASAQLQPIGGTTPTKPGASTAANDPNATPAMRQVHVVNVELIQAGQLAQQKGTTPNVKDYGKRLVDEHQRLDNELKQMAQKRGIQLQSDQEIQAIPEQQQNMQKLQALSGIQFDQAFTDLITNERTNRVPELKRLRDSIPGSDAELKKWLSDAEVTMERMRNESRNVRQAVREQAQQQQRQGRKP